MLDYVDYSEKEIELFYKKIVKNVKKARNQKNVSQLDLALTIGHKSVSIISKIEANLENKHYNIEHLYKIAKALEIDVCEFFKE